MDSNELITFKNETIGELRGFIKDGEPWFLAGKVCSCLGLQTAAAIRQVIDNHLRYGDKIDGVSISHVVMKDSLGRNNRVIVISESIMYELIFKSTKQKAFFFRQWIFKEVLPSLRKHGVYRTDGILVRKTLTDTIKEKIVNTTDNVNIKKFAYSQFTKLIYKSLGIDKKGRDTFTDKELEQVAHRENLAKALLDENKTYAEIKDILLAL